MPVGEFEDALEGQVLVLGHEHCLDVVTSDVGLFSIDHVLQEVHVDVVWKNRKVRKATDMYAP